MKCDVTHCVSNKVEYLDKEHSYKNSTKKLYCAFKLCFQCNQENTGKISFHICL